MKPENFQKLLEGNIIGGAEEALKANIDAILKQLNEATEEDREGFFDSLYNSTRYDVMEALIEQKALNESELFNIALKCKIDDLKIGVDTDSIPNRVHKAALDQLDEELIPELYSNLVNQLFIDRKNKVQLPSTETLEELYEGVFVERHDQALRKLHNFLGYYRGTAGQNSQELIDAVESDDQEKALKLISKGYYVYDFSGLDYFQNKKIFKFFFLNSLHHPNYNILAKGSYGESTLNVAACEGDTEAAKVMLGVFKGNDDSLKTLCAPDKDSDTPLNAAAWEGHTEFVKALLEAAKGNDELLKTLCTPDRFFNTPLHNAARFGHTDVVKEILEATKGKPELLKILCAPNISGETPLHNAAFEGRTESVKELLKYEDIDVNAKDKDGKTAADLTNYPEIKGLIEQHIKAKADQTRFLVEASTTAAQSATSSTAMPTPPVGVQVDSSAAQLPQTPNLGAQR